MAADWESMHEQTETTGDLAGEHVFSPDELIERCSGKVDFAQRILDVFLNNVQRDVDELLAAARSGNQTQLVQTAHRIKGSAASISAPRMQHLMAEIEAAGRLQEIPELEMLQRRVHTESQSLERVLTRWRSQEQSTSVTCDSLRPLPKWRIAF
jgi:HPt (histidine-containing phosphotransfer) domain-containing protein